MLTLQNAELRVDLLDPIDDRALLGPRFCWGGYIWQVHDRVAGPLLSGPEWPQPAPAPFNGQGLPESFRHRTLDGHSLTWHGEQGVAIGAGELRCDREDRVSVVTPCTWEIAQRTDRIEFSTRQSAAGFHYALERHVVLAGRELNSLTRLTNLSEHDPLVLEWFAHPFFALVDGAVLARLSADATIADNPGFALIRGVLTQKRRFTHRDDGHMERSLRLPADQPFAATLAHAALTELRFETSFAPDSYVIWGNDRTFSFEPYLKLHLPPRATREWSLRYGFGVSSGTSSSTVSSRLPDVR